MRLRAMLHLAAIVGAAALAAERASLMPYDSHISYVGRFDTSNSSGPTFSWVMSSIRVTVNSTTQVRVLLTSPSLGARIRVNVDGVRHQNIELPSKASGWHWYAVVSGLEPSQSHRIELLKITESFELMLQKQKALMTQGLSVAVGHPRDAAEGLMQFGGFAGDEGVQWGPAPPEAARRLEFIGDSDTTGWCVNGSWIKGQLRPLPYEDASLTWAAQTARTLGADMMVEAIAGWGVTRYSVGMMQAVYPYTNGVNESEWGFGSVPDAVVLLMGPNDQRLLPPRLAPDLISQYGQLLDMVASKYPTTVPLINVCGGSINGLTVCGDVSNASQAFNQHHQRVQSHYVSISESTWHKLNSAPVGQYKGCEGHYSEKGHAVLSTELVPQIKDVLQWD